MCVHVACLIRQKCQAGESLQVVCSARAIAGDDVSVVPLPVRNLVPCQSPGSDLERASARLGSVCLRRMHVLTLDS